MGVFRHTPDDLIVFDTDIIPLAFFLTLEPAYTLPVSPAGITHIEYDQGLTRYFASGNGTQYGMTYPDATIDGYISNKATYVAAYAAYLNPPLTLSQEKAKRIGEMMLYGEAIKDGNIVINGYTFSSTDEFFIKMEKEFESFTRTSIPMGYYVNDINYVPVSISDLGDVSEILDSINELHYECDVTADIHRAAINALTTIPDVLAYDYTVGWPVVPYDASITFYASYYSSIDADRSNGSPTGTPIGGAAIAGNQLDLAHDDYRYVDYSATGNADNPQYGIVKFYITPNYNTAPAPGLAYSFFTITKADGDMTNYIELLQIETGEIVGGIAGVTALNFGAWSPVLGTEYLFVFYYDITAGDTKLFIDGAQQGATNTDTGLRTADIGLLRVGGNWDSIAPNPSNFTIRDFYVFSDT